MANISRPTLSMRFTPDPFLSSDNESSSSHPSDGEPELTDSGDEVLGPELPPPPVRQFIRLNIQRNEDLAFINQARQPDDQEDLLIPAAPGKRVQEARDVEPDDQSPKASESTKRLKLAPVRVRVNLKRETPAANEMAPLEPNNRRPSPIPIKRVRRDERQTPPTQAHVVHRNPFPERLRSVNLNLLFEEMEGKGQG